MNAQEMKTYSAADAAVIDATLDDLVLNSGTNPGTLSDEDIAVVVSIDGTPVEASVVLPVATLASEREAFYKGMSAPDAKGLQDAAERIRTIQKKAILNLGNELIRIKDGMSGQFDRWLKIEFEWSKSTAWNIIKAVERFGSTPKVIEALPASTVYKLAADATPDAIRNAVVQEIASGKSLSRAEVERRIHETKGFERAGREQDREQRAADRKAIADAKAWEVKEKGLKKSGASDEDIQKERRAWDTAKAKSERKKDAKQKRAAERAQKVEREKQQRRDENQACEDRTRAAADFIRQRLASDLEALRSILDGDLNAWELVKALKA